LSAGAPPQTPLGELTALPRPPSWILGAYRGKGRTRGKGEEARNGEGRDVERGGRVGPPS